MNLMNLRTRTIYMCKKGDYRYRNLVGVQDWALQLSNIILKYNLTCFSPTWPADSSKCTGHAFFTSYLYQRILQYDTYVLISVVSLRICGLVKMRERKEIIVPEWKLQVSDFAVFITGNWYFEQKRGHSKEHIKIFVCKYKNHFSPRTNLRILFSANSHFLPAK